MTGDSPGARPGPDEDEMRWRLTPEAFVFVCPEWGMPATVTLLLGHSTPRYHCGDCDIQMEAAAFFPTPDADVRALAADIERALRMWEVPHDHIVVRPERRQRVVTLHLTSQATAGDLNAVCERIGDGEGVDYQPKGYRRRIEVDAFRRNGRKSP